MQYLGQDAQSAPLDPPVPGRQVVTGGIVAYNDEQRIEQSIRSLLSQELPCATEWGRIWVVASGCTDGTVEIARSLMEKEPRLRLLVEPKRRGKAAAIREVLRQAEGDLLILLNSDAVAAPGSVSALLAKAAGKPRPFAVMARPTVPAVGAGGWKETMRWMWDLHHELHLEMLADGRGAHLSDELLLVSLPAFPWIEDGIINDGSYCAVWLRNHSGGCWYAPDARVAIDVPRTPTHHLRQRRRIHVGNAQVRARLGRPPTTIVRYLFQHPTRTLLAVRRAISQERGIRHLFRVARWELVAHALAVWDRLPPRRDHVLWSRIANSPADDAPISRAIPSSVSPTDELDRRIRVLLEVANEFGTGIPIPQLAELLPNDVADHPEGLEAFLAGRPDLADVVHRYAYRSAAISRSDPERAGRGVRYRRAAEELVTGPLAWLGDSVRCIGITGSTAYGEPAVDDDLDFFVITRSGAVPWFLAATYLSLRLRRLRGNDADVPTACFNYVVDERRVLEEFGSARGLLFAREALTAQMIRGDSFYRGLLAKTPWLGGELPRLYAARSVGAGDTNPRDAPLLTRLLSSVVFLPLAAFLQLEGLRRNAAARRAGRTSEVFRTLTVPNRVAFQSHRFEQLRARYEGRGEPTPTGAMGGAPSRIPTATAR